MNKLTEINLPEDALANLPIFPLPNVVLFPRIEVPLHIFEPRYRQLLDDIVDEHRLFGLALLDNETSVSLDNSSSEISTHQPPPIYPVAGLAHLRTAARLPDGRYNIVIEGVARIDVSNEIPNSDSECRYRSANAKLMPTQAIEDMEALKNEFGSFFGLAHRVLRPLNTKRVRFDQSIESLREMIYFVDAVGSIALPSARHRQHLLSTDVLDDRMRIVSSALAELLIKTSHLESNPSNWGIA